jgi:hypothetical protein
LPIRLRNSGECGPSAFDQFAPRAAIRVPW